MSAGLSFWHIRFFAIGRTRRRRCNRPCSTSFRVFRSLDDVERFKQWAMRVVENEAKMYRRKRRQHLYESIDRLDLKPRAR